MFKDKTRKAHKHGLFLSSNYTHQIDIYINCNYSTIVVIYCIHLYIIAMHQLLSIPTQLNHGTPVQPTTYHATSSIFLPPSPIHLANLNSCTIYIYSNRQVYILTYLTAPLTIQPSNLNYFCVFQTIYTIKVTAIQRFFCVSCLTPNFTHTP